MPAKVLFVVVLLAALPLWAQVGTVCLISNPLTFAVREPVVLVQPVGDGAPLTFYDVKSGAEVLTQCDAVSEEQCELITLLTLGPGETRRLGVRPAKGKTIPAVVTRVTALPEKDSYTVSNGIFTFTLTINDPDADGCIYCPLTDFKFFKLQAPAGVRALEHFQLGGFTEMPDVTMRRGPLRARLILEGASALRCQAESIPGRTRTMLTVYTYKPSLDLETCFIPDRDGQLPTAGAGVLTVDTTSGLWKVFSPHLKTRAVVTTDFGVDAPDNTGTGKQWTAAMGPQSSFSYVCDDLFSTFAAKPGKGGGPRSQLRFNNWNFSETDNCINPCQEAVKFTAGTPSILRMRLTLYPMAHGNPRFAMSDYQQFLSGLSVKR